MFTVEIKKKIIRKHNQVMQVAIFARFYNKKVYINNLHNIKEEIMQLKGFSEYQSNGHMFWKIYMRVNADVISKLPDTSKEIKKASTRAGYGLITFRNEAVFAVL